VQHRVGRVVVTCCQEGALGAQRGSWSSTGLLELNREGKIYFEENSIRRKIAEPCTSKGKVTVNLTPVMTTSPRLATSLSVDWEDKDVWKYIHARKLPLIHYTIRAMIV
jgi:hypothetical protein